MPNAFEKVDTAALVSNLRLQRYVILTIFVQSQANQKIPRADAAYDDYAHKIAAGSKDNVESTSDEMLLLLFDLVRTYVRAARTIELITELFAAP
jgi:hypothetical protein